MNAVRLDRVTIGLGGRTILADISLTIDQGEFIGLLGPNGAGKTTLLRAILGLVRPRQGRLDVLGEPARRGNPAIGYLPQMHRAVAGLRLSGWNFVASAFDGHRWGLPRASGALQREVDWALDAVGAREIARRALADISGGERQRLLLAQALLGRPRLLLLDEPLISLDPHHQRHVLELVRRLQQEMKITVLFSAHEINPLLGVIDRVLYLGHGQAALGSVEDVITGPVLSRLYGSEIEVIRLGGRIFVMTDGHDLEHAEHRHDAHL
ncbi:MAG TPA: ATP-binding cassette domain-containing protein [Hypericibacter adhaerens]|uniref:ABC transporter ATP-binding protein n=1 Tax=Hypericibacter adhaerens TaxID=2602016 RepID=A0A5J6NA09_9PROT|nr:ATP-binding cassette domain-containing protein [Hypericibacter adhaerens]QEX24446.1 ABC transporter ATP-binding protein [Hypericibacter adhaerens]HWA45732.1 ATP-binding cassette domain-containing protein [Hypericibacter adhaerens]